MARGTNGAVASDPQLPERSSAFHLLSHDWRLLIERSGHGWPPVRVFQGWGEGMDLPPTVPWPPQEEPLSSVAALAFGSVWREMLYKRETLSGHYS